MRCGYATLQVDWKTGNIFTVGGWVGQLDGRAFNFGGFSFVNTARYVGGEIIPATFEHESGHMLSNAAFGFFQPHAYLKETDWTASGSASRKATFPPGCAAPTPSPPNPTGPRFLSGVDLFLSFLNDRITPLSDPQHWKTLKGSRLSEFWKYRVSDYRVIAR